MDEFEIVKLVNGSSETFDPPMRVARLEVLRAIMPTLEDKYGTLRVLRNGKWFDWREAKGAS